MIDLGSGIQAGDIHNTSVIAREGNKVYGPPEMAED